VALEGRSALAIDWRILPLPGASAATDAVRRLQALPLWLFLPVAFLPSARRAWLIVRQRTANVVRRNYLFTHGGVEFVVGRKTIGNLKR
jgi:hypothetical protein